MKINLEREVKMDRDVSNYDYKLYSLFDDNGNYHSNIFEMNKKGFVNLYTNKFFDTIEMAAKSAIKIKRPRKR